MLAPEVHPAPKSTKHHGRAQVVIGGSTRETQVLFFTETEAREWATIGKKAADGPNFAALPAQVSPVQLQKPPTPDTQPAAVPADSLADAWSTTPTAPDPVSAPAADPGDTTPAATSPAADDDQAVGLREAAEHHLPYTLAALRYARANDRTFPGPVDKRGAESTEPTPPCGTSPATGRHSDRRTARSDPRPSPPSRPSCSGA
ncbi:hypothetical protein AB0N37_31800 [Streptomyces griseoincarnatus]|uniref:hypothetical protein n=1 Tax=Streptomyces sp. RK31 TaxID=2824892 RepID=UPI001B38FCEB|nr:hypothetical protein [Streptomyces sp. RK31]MBQ0975581.1 hypothetical protein [Streptomyces sp. RK31]